METRHREAILIFKISFIQSMLTSLMFVLPTLASVVSFIVHIESGNDLKASQAYSLIAIYNILCVSPRVTLGPRSRCDVYRPPGTCRFL